MGFAWQNSVLFFFFFFSLAACLFFLEWYLNQVHACAFQEVPDWYCEMADGMHIDWTHLDSECFWLAASTNCGARFTEPE